MTALSNRPPSHSDTDHYNSDLIASAEGKSEVVEGNHRAKMVFVHQLVGTSMSHLRSGKTKQIFVLPKDV